MPLYIHERKDWPSFRWDAEALAPTLAEAYRMLGLLLGKMQVIGFDLRTEANLDTLTVNVLRSSEIEGEILDPSQVRSSLARRLGLDMAGVSLVDRHVDGVVEMHLDATEQCRAKLDAERLFAWHSALFPSGRSGMLKVLTGQWRNDSTGLMQVVSGPMGREKVHFQAPAADRLKKEMATFLKWVNKKDGPDPMIKAGLAHLWFVTIHPFEDGNGRIARAIADLLLARADGSPQRYYSMSAQIRAERGKYYDLLQRTQQGTMDVTGWLAWFLACLCRALVASETMLASVLNKHRFWQNHAQTLFNSRQLKVLNKLFHNFQGSLTSTKYAKIARTSQDTASRDIADLIAKKVLRKGKGGGRNTHYVLAS